MIASASLPLYTDVEYVPSKSNFVRGLETEILLSKDTSAPSLLYYYQKQLVQISRKISQTLDIDEIWQQTVRDLGKSLAVSRCLICSYSPSSSQVEVVAEYCQEPFPSLLGQQLQLAIAPALQQALSSFNPVATEAMPANLFGAESALVVATSYQNQPNGLIILQQCDRPRQWYLAEAQMLREIAEQLGAARARECHYQQLENNRQQAEAASRLKSEFLAHTSHEMRTPLNGMIGSLKLILEGMADDPEEQREFLQSAYHSALHLLNIVNDILDIAKIESGQINLHFEPVNLKQLFTQVTDFILPQSQQKNLNFSVQLPTTEKEVIVYGNYQRLLQVLFNLIGNAIKFTQVGGIAITAEAIEHKVIFKGQEFPSIMKISVVDTGIGVALDKQNKLFHSFSQLHSDRHPSYGGTGLGLTISQKLVEAMGGTITFYSMGEGLGSTVTFTIPLYWGTI